MLIDFSKIEPLIIKNFRAGNKDTIASMYVDDKNKIMYGKLEQGASIGYHCHETSSEIIYIVSGKAEAVYDGEIEYLDKGMCHYCVKGHSHSLMNNEQDDLIFFTVVPEQ